MPRAGRQLSESHIYHVMIRGNERKKIFLDDEDREEFLNILRRKKRDQTFSFLAWCLMDNHVHFVLDEGKEEIAKIMQRINVSYVYFFNKKYNRSGHLFQDRFKSEPIENERYMLAAIRYVHMNPVKACITDNPGEYRWSSYNAILDRRLYSEIVDRKRILAMFSDNEEQAIQQFIEFTKVTEDDKFIDVADNENTEKVIWSKAEVHRFIIQFTKSRGIAEVDNIWKNKELSNELIRQLKLKSSLSIRELASILNIDRNKIQRA